MTSLWRHSRLTYYELGPNFLTQGMELLPREVWQVSKRNSQYFRSYLWKTTAGRRLTLWMRHMHIARGRLTPLAPSPRAADCRLCRAPAGPTWRPSPLSCTCLTGSVRTPSCWPPWRRRSAPGSGSPAWTSCSGRWQWRQSSSCCSEPPVTSC